jgi:hypothetical protein
MKLMSTISKNLVGRGVIALVIYIVYSVVFVELNYVFASLYGFEKQFKLLPLSDVFIFHLLSYWSGYATVPVVYEWATWLFWLVFWCSLIYLRIYSIQQSKKSIFLHWGFVFGVSIILSVLNSVALGNNGPQFFNLYFSGVLWSNLPYAIAVQFVPLRFFERSVEA